MNLNQEMLNLKASSERRRFVRVEVARGVNWRGPCGFDNLDRIHNISEDGMGMIARRALLAMGDIIQLEFQLPESHAIHSQAQVRWIVSGSEGNDADYVGLQFLNIGATRQDEIRYFIGKHRYECH